MNERQVIATETYGLNKLTYSEAKAALLNAFAKAEQEGKTVISGEISRDYVYKEDGEPIRYNFYISLALFEKDPINE